MTGPELAATVVGSVVAPVLVAAMVGGGRVLARWLAAMTRALGAVPELARDVRELGERVRELAEAATDVRVLRAELLAHVAQADDRWASLGGIVPHPRYTYPGTDDRRRRVITTAGEPA